MRYLVIRIMCRHHDGIITPNLCLAYIYNGFKRYQNELIQKLTVSYDFYRFDICKTESSTLCINIFCFGIFFILIYCFVSRF